MTKKCKVTPTKWRKSARGGKVPFQGIFYPANVEKYKGDVNNIIFRSGLELRLFKFLDERNSVLEWSSEETIIPYISPKDGQWHRYFVDVKIVSQNKAGEIKTYLIEVKPFSQCKPPVVPKKVTKKSQYRYLKESRVYEINLAKWKYAEAVCNKKGWEFIKMTEKDLIF